MKKTIFALSLTTITFFGSISSVTAATNTPTSSEVSEVSRVESQSQSFITNEVVQPKWKSKVARESIEKLADLLDSGYIDNILEALPNEYFKDTLLDSRDDIVANLRDLAALGDAGEEMIQNVIVQAIMTATPAPSSTANTIANIIVFLFL